MAFDFKKEFKEYYLPPKKPVIIEIPSMNFLAVRGKGNPNEENGAYSEAMNELYGIAFTLKMSYKGPHKIDGFFEYVVPPLEGLWWQPGIAGVDYARKEDFNWISLIRLPDFIKPADFEWAVGKASEKKDRSFPNIEFFTYDEGFCVQCLHLGPYDDEPKTVALMEDYATANGYAIDITSKRHHHEIYLGDPRKAKPENLKTVIRHPVKKV